ncbi:carbohydrate kinase [Candidatus Pseudothioglobus singularis]|jgi:fructokinase|nr:carbohydrate kinase [Candidatus Pseudothioglobus singularis]MDA7448060.1 carbohydrate kinase [Candidatus Pseudothioglobus singularis]MDB4822282.1 carbohydrate kinase [Candidatus Pseudothioglobus singularis]MDC1046739.1 carbohydrate kinase [Candidatus Pseudothioglobus singularis]MDC3216553.1 carbohydrate kinase [Candidatus Pseudothioglobus singularis]|tara:strand:+ start:84 stop:1010 length:927 start_codon:yes stop_codon:yes gene_type:complete
MIICAGESLVDMVSFRGEPEYTPHVGGSNFNSSIALGRLGADSYYFGAISNDSYGELIENTLRHSKVKEDFVIKTNRPTTLAYADVVDGIAEYTFVDEHSAGRLLDQTSLKPFVNRVMKAKALVVGGISLQAEPCGSSWQWFIEQVSGQLPIYFDANIRPDFIENKQSYLNRFVKLTSKVDIIKISEEDYRYLYGAQDFNKVSKVWLDNGVKLVIFTLGSEGSKVIFDNDKEVFVKSKKVDVVDTIAAGDSFNAGFLLSLDEQGLLDRVSLDIISDTQLEKALSYANKVASITVTKKGANPPWLHQIK